MSHDYESARTAQQQVAALEAVLKDVRTRRADAVRDLLAEGAAVAEIGRQIGLTEGAVRAIRRGGEAQPPVRSESYSIPDHPHEEPEVDYLIFVPGEGNVLASVLDARKQDEQ